jgi:hypothetical protein
MRRALPALLVVLAALADARGAHGLAFDALLGAIPFTAVSGLVGFGAYLEDRDDSVAGVQALLWTLALTLLVVSCAARSPATQTSQLPALGRSALIGALGILAVKAAVWGAALARRSLLPAKP